MIYFCLPVLIIAILLAWSRERNAVFASEVALWEDNLLKSPRDVRVLVNLAWAYKRAGRDEDGIAALTRAIEIKPMLADYFQALIYAQEHGGRLITEKDLWNDVIKKD